MLHMDMMVLLVMVCILRWKGNYNSKNFGCYIIIFLFLVKMLLGLEEKFSTKKIVKTCCPAPALGHQCFRILSGEDGREFEFRLLWALSILPCWLILGLLVVLSKRKKNWTGKMHPQNANRRKDALLWALDTGILCNVPKNKKIIAWTFNGVVSMQ